MTAAAPSIAYVIFCAGVFQTNSEKLVTVLSNLTQNQVTEVHLVMHTLGGAVNDGFFIYNLLRSYPLELIAHNMGYVGSAGVAAFLGAKRRVVAKNATFMIHRTTNGQQGGNSTRLKAITSSIEDDDARTIGLYRSELSLPADIWAQFEHHDVNISAEKAVEYGIAHEIGDFSPPRGAMIFHVTP